MFNHSVAELAYLAGIIDGEGTVSIYCHRGRHEYTLRLYVVNTDARVIKWLKDTFGGAVYSRKPKVGWKTKWEWHMANKAAHELVSAIMPFLIIKREQASLALTFRDDVGKGRVDRDLREDCFQKMRSLNHREWLAAETN